METIIKISCHDEKGLVHKITGVLFDQKVNVTQTNEFVAEDSERFFMRISFTGTCDVDLVKKQIIDLLPENSLVEIIPPKKKKIVVLVTKEHHCLGDLLIKNQFQDLPFEILAVIGNHDTLKNICNQFNVPFHWINAEGLDRETHENKVAKVIDQYNPDLIVLAKYMRILTSKFSSQYLGRLINIHHSFLPAFIGANPYVQAFEQA